MIKDNTRKIAAVLLDIRSSENAGSICRTAECAGVDEMYCVGTTPTHIDRFGRENKKFTKASLGAEKHVKVEHHKDINLLLKKLKKEKFKIISLEQAKGAKDYKNINLKGNFAIILGNEVNGISQKVLKQTDEIAEIKMAGRKESLNVSVAFGVAIFRILAR